MDTNIYIMTPQEVHEGEFKEICQAILEMGW